MNEDTKERLRMGIEDAVVRALEAGMPRAEIEEEVRYALDSAEEST
jgi:hypothetical protein